MSSTQDPLLNGEEDHENIKMEDVALDSSSEGRQKTDGQANDNTTVADEDAPKDEEKEQAGDVEKTKEKTKKKGKKKKKKTEEAESEAEDAWKARVPVPCGKLLH